MERNDAASLIGLYPEKEKKARDHSLVTKNVVAGRDGEGNGDCLRIVCGDELVGCPRSWACGVRGNTSKIGGHLSPTDNGRRISLVGVLVKQISGVPNVH